MKRNENNYRNDTYIIKKLLQDSLVVLIIIVLASTIGMLVDGIIIGTSLGVNCTVAYGLASPIFVFIAAVAGIFSSGCQTRCGTNLGKGEFQTANDVFSITVVSSLLSGSVLMLLLLVLIHPICSLLGAPISNETLYPLTSDYIIGLSFAVPAILVGSSLSSIMQIDGDKMRPIISTVIMTVVNIIGDLLNVHVIHGGMLGMAIATTISYYVNIVVLYLHFKKKNIIFKIGLKQLKWNELKETLFVGLPSAISRGCVPLRNLCLNRLLLVLAGSSAVAAFSVQSSLNNLFGSVGTAVGMATLLIAGIIYGEEDIASASKLLKVSLKMGTIITSVIGILLFCCAKYFTSLFLKDPTVLEYATVCVRFYAISIPLHAVNTVFMNYLQGMHNIKFAHTIGILDNFAYITLLSLLLGNIIGINGVWISYILSELVMILTLVIVSIVRNKKIPCSIDDFLFLPKGFGVPEEERFDASITTMEQVMNISERIETFCKEKGHYDSRTMSVALCVEEIAGNIVKYGFNDDKKHCIDLRIMKKNGDYIIRIRDDCRAFNPEKQLERKKPEDSAYNIGIRVVYGLAKEVKYVNTMNMNNLMIKI